MENTLKLMKTINVEPFNKMSLQELAATYTDGTNPSVLASAFCQTYNMIHKVSSFYFGLDTQDIASYALETLDFCLQTFEGQGAFTTYFYIVLRNRFRTETESLSTNKRRVIFNKESLDLSLELGIDPTHTQDDYFKESLPDCISGKVTKKEEDYCKLLLYGYKNSEIANILNVSQMTLCNYRKAMRTKLQPILL